MRDHNMIANANTEHVFVSFRRQLSIDPPAGSVACCQLAPRPAPTPGSLSAVEAAAEAEASGTMQNRLPRPKRSCDLDHSRVPWSVNAR
jgi:hypothetical protein